MPDKLLLVTDTAVVTLQARQEKRKGIMPRPLHFFIDLKVSPSTDLVLVILSGLMALKNSPEV